jgi:hypothetical protein
MRLTYVHMTGVAVMQFKPIVAPSVAAQFMGIAVKAGLQLLSQRDKKVLVGGTLLILGLMVLAESRS